MRDLVLWRRCASCIENAVFYNVYFNFRVRTAESRRLLIRLRGWIAQTRNSEGESSPCLFAWAQRGDASCLLGDFQVPFPGDSTASCEPWKRGVTNALSAFPGEIKFRLNGSPSAFYLLPAGASARSSALSEIKGSLSLFPLAFVSFSLFLLLLPFFGIRFLFLENHRRTLTFRNIIRDIRILSSGTVVQIYLVLPFSQLVFNLLTR